MDSGGLPEEVIKKAASEIARRNAKKRWDATTAKERTDVARRLNEARWKGKTKKQKSATASKAARARWAKKATDAEGKKSKRPK
jgi:hypothetical protein